MANGNTHRRVGQWAGASTAVWKARREPVAGIGMEAVGGWFGGALGGMLPDQLEPPTSPNHRGSFHSVTAAASILTLVNYGVNRAQRYCRAQARHWEAQSHASQNVFATGFYLFLASLWRLASGFFAGIEGGYVSHLLLDGGTPAGLPVI